MTPYRRTAAALLVLSALTFTACGAENTSEQTANETSSPSSASLTPGDGAFIDSASVDRSDADATAEAAAVLIHSWDTATDKTQTAGAVRAKPLMSQEWADNQVEPQRNAAQGDWLVPSQHQAYSVASLTPAPGDTTQDVAPDRAIRAYHAHWTWNARDGRELKETGKQEIVLYLERHQGQWSVVGHTTDPTVR